MSLAADETIALFGPQQGLQDNQKYVYTVTAFNNIGLTSTRSKIKQRRAFVSNLVASFSS